MKNRYMITSLCAIALGLVAAASPNAGLISLHSTPNDVSKLPQVDVLNAYAKTTPDTNQANLELKIDPNYIDSYDIKPAINTEPQTRTQIYHHSS
jgi:hypothetical protein